MRLRFSQAHAARALVILVCAGLGVGTGCTCGGGRLFDSTEALVRAESASPSQVGTGEPAVAWLGRYRNAKTIAQENFLEYEYLRVRRPAAMLVDVRYMEEFSLATDRVEGTSETFLVPAGRVGQVEWSQGTVLFSGVPRRESNGVVLVPDRAWTKVKLE